MPMAFLSIPTPLKRPTLLIVGCGDVGMRVVRLLRGRWRLLALTSHAARVPALRAAGVRPLGCRVTVKGMPQEQAWEGKAWRT